jgi:hypothetical protein
MIGSSQPCKACANHSIVLVCVQHNNLLHEARCCLNALPTVKLLLPAHLLLLL